MACAISVATSRMTDAGGIAWSEAFQLTLETLRLTSSAMACSHDALSSGVSPSAVISAFWSRVSVTDGTPRDVT
ncbi:hypothetical protein GLUCOINTEAF2_0204012 [Komagataeibacter intermedius AF2]|uniref:Uncharacterized protein n=1 Tax=Komagataeibacter intermedius AF2 TaxID=1458464 RepID=A0A0N1N5J4_9PROT|nr:hypothetical protein GLUCOINTEAF2_0204012 [Komagataeibacter intermedius AF2]